MVRRATVRLVGWIAVAAMVLAGLAVWTHRVLGGQAPLPPGVDPGASLGGSPAPALRLQDQSGAMRALAGFQGRVVVLGFVDGGAGGIGALTAQMMRDARALLGAAGPLVQLVAVNANPSYTTVADVRVWTDAHGMAGQWLFLTGPPSALAPVWSAFHVAVVPGAAGAVQYTPAVYVIDRAGDERWVFTTPQTFSAVPAEARVLAQRIAALLPGRPRVRPLSVLGGGVALPTGGPFTLSALLPSGGTGEVSVGQGAGGAAPHVVAFFATWCQACRQDLRSLVSYQGQAPKAGLPQVVAVDLRVAEPSTAWVQTFVQARHLDFPVTLDTSGRVADAYGVTALPYLAVVSADGRILWRHEGVLSAAALEARVRTALRSSG